MKELKFGVFSTAHTRLKTLSNTVHQNHHFKGELILCSSNFCVVVDTFAANLKPSVEAYREYFESKYLISAQYPNLAPNASYFDYNDEPITWFNSLEEAETHRKQQPINFVICQTAPVRGKSSTPKMMQTLSA